MTEAQNTTTEIKLFEALPSDKLYPIHNDLRKYHNKWSQDQVIELADTSGIENFYTTTQYLTRTAPIIGAGLVAKGYTEAGVVTAGVSLYTDYLISRGKEKLFKSEEKKKKLAELNKDIENLYDRHEELLEILKPIRNSDSLEELNKLLNTLKEELSKIAQKGEINNHGQENNWERWLSYIFWSLRKDRSSNIKELILLNNGIKILESWNKLSLPAKTWSELSRLFISLRGGNQLWAEWKQKWEDRKKEHEKIKDLTSILQTAISEYQQGISSEEIEEGIKNEMSKLEAITLEFEKEPLFSTSNNNSSSKLLEDKNTPSIGSTSQPTNVFRKRTISNSKENRSSQEIYELVDLQSREELQTKIEVQSK